MMDYYLKYLQSHWKDTIKGTSVVDFKRGQTLFYEGHYPNGVFVILSGELHFEKGNSCKSAEEHYSKIDQGKVVGLSQILSDTPSCCSCIAVTDCKTIFISKTLFDPILKKQAAKRS